MLPIDVLGLVALAEDVVDQAALIGSAFIQMRSCLRCSECAKGCSIERTAAMTAFLTWMATASEAKIVGLLLTQVNRGTMP